VHEAKLCLSLLELAERHATAAGAARIVALRLELGELAGVAAEALAAVFPICARGTCADGAALRIERTRGRDLVLRDLEVL
jgi:hydrogenase nickel incorporation protein HypA/HybF